MPRAHDPALIAAVGRRLREVREQRGLAQERLAELVGVDPVTMSRVEHGAGALSITNLARAATSLQVPLSALFDFDAPVEAAAVPPVEHDLLVHFRRLSDEHQAALVKIARVLAEAQGQ